MIHSSCLSSFSMRSSSMCFVAYDATIWSCWSILACTSASTLCPSSFHVFLPTLPPTQPAIIYGCRYTKLLCTIDVIGARPDDFLRMVTLNHTTLWVRTIPHVALQNGHVSLKRIHLM